MKLGILIFLVLGGVACGDGARDRENYGDVSATVGGIQLTSQEEHQAGWGRRDCLMCHNVSLNVHRRAGNGLDAGAIAATAQTSGGSAYCLNCHGPNGLN